MCQINSHEEQSKNVTNTSVSSKVVFGRTMISNTRERTATETMVQGQNNGSRQNNVQLNDYTTKPMKENTTVMLASKKPWNRINYCCI